MNDKIFQTKNFKDIKKYLPVSRLKNNHPEADSRHCDPHQDLPNDELFFHVLPRPFEPSNPGSSPTDLDSHSERCRSTDGAELIEHIFMSFFHKLKSTISHHTRTSGTRADRLQKHGHGHADARCRYLEASGWHTVGRETTA